MGREPKEIIANVDSTRFVHEDREERTYTDERNGKGEGWTTLDAKLLDLDPKKFLLVHETVEKRTYEETPLKIRKVEGPCWEWIADTGIKGRIIHEIIVKRCYVEITDDDE